MKNKTMTADLEPQIIDVLTDAPGVRLGILFGSAARGLMRFDSDVDLAVIQDEPLTADEKMALIDKLAQRVERPVDLIDLHKAHGVILRQIIATGTRIYDPDPDHKLYAELLTRNALNQADFGPYRRRLLAERRKRWIGT